MNTPLWLVIVKDLVAITLAAFIIIYQTVTGNVNGELLTFAGLILGVSGVANVLWARDKKSNSDGDSPQPQPQEHS